MKLSAPPPPPPEPPEPGPTPEPDGGRDPRPDAAPGATLDSAAAAVPAPTPTAGPKPATWPGWFGGMDVALAVLAVAVAFLAASFAARNSDLWLHLGAGRMLTTGEYKLGSDPFSYTAADRAWVNHSWLFDLGAYLLYRGDGFALVLAKALAAAAAAGLLIGVRRAGQPLWPWAVGVAVAAVAAAPRLTLQPAVGSVFFLALTLFLVFRAANPPGSWRLPISIGVTFWLWANVDGWFVLGPAVLGLLLVGELVRTKLAKAEPTAGDEDDPLGRLPDAATLSRSVLVGVVACMLNPHHVRVWEIPFELTESVKALTGDSAVNADTRMRGVLMSPLRGAYWQNEAFGSNPNGFAYAVLLAAGVYAVFLSGAVGRVLGRPFDVDPLPLPLALLWGGFALLSLLTVQAIPFLAIVTVPLVASRLNVFSGRVVLGDRADRRTRLVLLGSGFGRVFTLLALLVVCVMAWPGKLHPPVTNPATARFVAWAVEPDPALVKAAGQFQRWRADGDLPADARGLITSVDLANYCAWYAPLEKVFLNARYAFHRPEQPGFTEVRASLRLFPNDDPPPADTVRTLLKAQQVAYVVISSDPGDTPATRAATLQTALHLATSWERWSPWYLDGRTEVLGWRASPAESSPVFAALRLNPSRLAFGVGGEPAPPPKAELAPAPRGWADEFLHPARPGSPAAVEALAWLDYKQAAGVREAQVYQVRALLLRNVPGVANPPLAGNLFQAQAEAAARSNNAPLFHPEDGSFQAIPILAVRAARRAIADAPDHPDGYYALAQALADPDLPLTPSERVIGRVTALNQCLARLPAPDAFQRGVYFASPTRTALELYQLYLNPAPNGFTRGVPVDLPGVRELIGEVAVARGKTLQRVQYAAVQADRLPDGVQVVDPTPAIVPLDLAQLTLEQASQYTSADPVAPTPEGHQAFLKSLDEERKRVVGQLRQANDQFTQAAERAQGKARDRYGLARRFGLVGRALEFLKGMNGDDLSKEFGPELPDVLLQMTALELAVGRLPEAAGDIESVKTLFDNIPPGQVDPRRMLLYRVFLRQLTYQKLYLEGDYAAAGAELEEIEGKAVGAALPPDLQKFKPAPYARFGPGFLAAAMFGATDGPFGEVGRLFLGEVQLQQFGLYRNAIEGRLNREATFFFRRGFLSLLEGDVPAAKTRFEQAHRHPPPGWGLNDVTHVSAAAYLRLINMAEKKTTRP